MATPPSPDSMFNFNVNFVMAAAALFLSILNALWDRIRLEHRITKMETIQEIYLKNMTEDAVHVAKHPTAQRKDDLIEKGIRKLTDEELEELHTLLAQDIPKMKEEEDPKLPGYATAKAIVEIEQFKRSYPPQKPFLQSLFDFFRGIKTHENACKKALGETQETKDRNIGRDTGRDIIRDSARDATRDVIRDRTRDVIRDKDRDETHDYEKKA